MKTQTGTGGRPLRGSPSPVSEQKTQPVPINRKAATRNLTPPSLAEKIGVNVQTPKQAAPKIIQPKPITRPPKAVTPPKSLQSKEVGKTKKPEVSIVPVNRKVVKPSKIKHLSKPKKAPRPTAKAVPINRKVVKQRTSETFLSSDKQKREDVVAVIESNGAPEKDYEVLSRQKTSTDEDLSTPGNETHSPETARKDLKMAPMEGKWPNQQQLVNQEEKKSSQNELQMVPIEGGRPYQDKKIESTEAAPKKRDIGTPKNEASHNQNDLNMVPVEAGHRERQHSMKPVEGGLRRGEAALVKERPKAPKNNSVTSEKKPARKKQDLYVLKQKKPEKVFGNFIEEIKSEAVRQDYSMIVNPRGKMKVEFSSQSKALIVAFEKQNLPFDRIVLKQTVPPHLDRRQQLEEAEEKPGLIENIKKLIGTKKPKKKIVERRGPQNRHLIGHLCNEKGHVKDWEVGSSDQVSTASSNSQVAVAAQYRVQGERNFWTVQLVHEAGASTEKNKTQEIRKHLSDSGIKKSLIVLLDGLGDAIHGDLVKAT